MSLPVAVNSPVKPKFGETCNGCGMCCKQQACDLSRDFLKSTVAPCIALEHEDGRYWCGLVRTPSKYLKLPKDWADPWLSCTIAYTLGLGKGCDADDEDVADALRDADSTYNQKET